MVTCRVCGCSDQDACYHPEHGNCRWVEHDLCSHCKFWPGESVRYSEVGYPISEQKREELLLKIKTNKSRMKKITILLAQLMPVLKKMKEVLPEKPVVPVYGSVLLQVSADKVVLVGTDTLMTVIGTIECTAEESMELLLPFKFLHDICSEITEEELTLEINVKGILLRTESLKINIGGLSDVNDFPKVPEFPKAHKVAINSDVITCLSKALLSVATETSRPAMCKVLVSIDKKYVTVVSTNSYILYEEAVHIEDSNGEAELLLSKTAITAMKGEEVTALFWNKNHIGFEFGNIQLMARIQDEEYPKYKSIIPAKRVDMTIKRADFERTMVKMLLTGSPAFLYLKKEIGHVVVESKDDNNNRQIEERLPYDYTNSCEHIKITPAYVLKVLKQIDHEEITLAIFETHKAILVTCPTNEQYRGLIMPVS